MGVGEYMYFNGKISEGFRDLFFFFKKWTNTIAIILTKPGLTEVLQAVAAELFQDHRCHIQTEAKEMQMSISLQ